MTNMHRCVYVTNGWGIHDDRWVTALRQQGFKPTIVRLGIDATTPEELRAAVRTLASDTIPILAGPLDAVTCHLLGLDLPIVGLSWGFDLMEMSDTTWLPGLSGLIVDAEATERIALAAGVPADRITMIPWGVDLSVFTPEGPQANLQTWNVPSSSTVLLSLRAHEPRYRIHDILNGFARVAALHPKSYLLVGNQGSLTYELQEHAASLGLGEQVRFIGTIDEVDLPALFRVADVYISASSVDGTSVTLLQAMACGIPVLVSKTPGNAAWITDGVSGLTFTTGDSADLADQLTAFLCLPPASIKLLTSTARTAVSRDADWQSNLPRLADALTGLTPTA